jgi:hypothetical protein
VAVTSDSGTNHHEVNFGACVRGAATLAFSLTGNHELIMGLGDWRSNAYLGYREISDQSRCVLPRLMAASATDTVSRAA